MHETKVAADTAKTGSKKHFKKQQKQTVIWLEKKLLIKLQKPEELHHRIVQKRLQLKHKILNLTDKYKKKYIHLLKKIKNCY